MEAHALDLRSEIDKTPMKANAEAIVAAIKDDWRKAELPHADRSLCVFAEKLTKTPGDMERADVERLRAAGLTFRNDIVTGPGGQQILLDDPAGNPLELFQPASAQGA